MPDGLTDAEKSPKVSFLRGFCHSAEKVGTFLSDIIVTKCAILVEEHPLTEYNDFMKR